MTMPLGIKFNDPSCTAKPFEEFSPVRKKVGAEVTPLTFLFSFSVASFMSVNLTSFKSNCLNTDNTQKYSILLEKSKTGL